MTRDQFLRILEEAKQGKPSQLNSYFDKLYKKVCGRLIPFTKSETEAVDVFAEVIARFWILFVEGDRDLPSSNIDGYIFTMAKMLSLERHRKNSRSNIVPIQTASITSVATGEPLSVVQEEKKLEELQYDALYKAISKMEAKCKRLFKYILKLNVDKPRELWEPLGYKNARTLSSVKNECLKKLKKTAWLEFRGVAYSAKEKP